MELEPTISREDLVAPLSEGSPCGEDLRWEGIYDELDEARREEEDVTGGVWQREGKKADWKKVKDLAEEALRTRTKDLHVTARLTEALLHLHGFAGLYDGLWVLRELTTRYWDQVYPEIDDDGDLDFRTGPFQWANSNLSRVIYQVPLTVAWSEPKRPRGASLQDFLEGERIEQIRAQDFQAAEEEVAAGKFDRERFQQAVGETPYSTWQTHRLALEGCWQEFSTLYAVCTERFGDELPNMSDLRQALERAKDLVESAEQRLRPQDSGEEGETETETLVQPDPIRTALRTAESLFRGEPESPLSYLISRAAAWGNFICRQEPPPLYAVEPPSPETRQKLKQLWNDGQYQELLARSEGEFRKESGRVWMDLQRYSAQALEAMGGEAYYGARAVKLQMAWFLETFPDFHRQTFPDDSPLANAESVAWLEQIFEEFCRPPEPEPEAEEVPVEEPPELFLIGNGAVGLATENEEIVKARLALQEGRLDEAITTLLEQAGTSSTGRERFQANLLLAEGFLMARRAQPALKTYEELASQIDRHHLEDWEPKHDCARVWTGLYQCLDLAMMDETTRSAKKSDVYGRLFRLDPKTALQFED